MLSVYHTQYMGTKNQKIPDKMEGEDEFLDSMQTQKKKKQKI